MIAIEPMRWWHIETVHRIESEVFPVDRWSVEQFWSELAQPSRRYFVATEGDALLGYAGVFVLPPDADVQTIAVAPHAMGRGIGRLLLDELIGTARSCACTQLVLEVRSDNDAAIGLYEHRGFVPISSRSDYYAPGVDALIMRLRPLEAT